MLGEIEGNIKGTVQWTSDEGENGSGMLLPPF